jgi:hypothetical protein
MRPSSEHLRLPGKLPFAAGGAVLLAFSAIGYFSQPQQFFFSYLFAWLFWTGLSLGCLLVTMIHQLTGGRWGYPTRRFFEAGFMVLPLLALLFIPLLFGLHYIYPWADGLKVAQDPVLHQRHGYQNIVGFIIRSGFFFAAMSWFAVRLRRHSLAQDATPEPEPTRAARAISGPGVVVYPLLATFIYVDWIMSTETHWRSTIFPIIIVIGQILTAYAFAILMLAAVRNRAPFAEVIDKTHFHHLGSLLFTFVLFWTYVSFGQLLIIYSGDLPEEVDWYLHRIATSWKVVVALLAVLHFFTPFFLLLFRGVKKNVRPLSIIAAVVFTMHILHIYWLVMPALHRKGVNVSWMDLTAVLGIGALWVSWFLHQFSKVPALPQHDPGIQFAFKYEHQTQC